LTDSSHHLSPPRVPPGISFFLVDQLSLRSGTSNRLPIGTAPPVDRSYFPPSPSSPNPPFAFEADSPKRSRLRRTSFLLFLGTTSRSSEAGKEASCFPLPSNDLFRPLLSSSHALLSIGLLERQFHRNLSFPLASLHPLLSLGPHCQNCLPSLMMFTILLVHGCVVGDFPLFFFTIRIELGSESVSHSFPFSVCHNCVALSLTHTSLDLSPG